MLLAAFYVIDPNRIGTMQKLRAKGNCMGTDYMLSSLNVTAMAQDRHGLMWIGTSAGINVYDGRSYTQFFHDSRDTTALPDDYINVLHADRMGRMWVGTQNGLAVYAGGGWFHRIRIPSRNSNITSIEEAPDGGVIASTAQQSFRIDGRGARPIGKQEQAPAAPAAIPDAPYSLRKPQEVVSCTCPDSYGNVWVGFRNAGFQIVSPSATAFKHANDNALAAASKGKDVIAVQAAGSYILASTTLRLYVYDVQDNRCSEAFYSSLLGIKPYTGFQVNNIVALDDDRAWLVANTLVASCTLSASSAGIVAKASGAGGSMVKMGSGVKWGDSLYVSGSGGTLLKFAFAATKPEPTAIGSRWMDEETQLAALHDGRLLMFMKDMHIAVCRPRGGAVQHLKLTGDIPQGNTDPAFVREDSYGNVWLGTKRSGLYRLDLHRRHIERMNFVGDVHIQGLAEDHNRRLWITTLKDVVCHDPKTGVTLMNSLLSSSQNEWNRQYFDNAVCTSPGGDAVFGSSDGCLFLPKRQIDACAASTAPVGGGASRGALCIYALEVNTRQGRTLLLADDIKNGRSYCLAHDENTLNISFFRPNYGRSSTLTYQYRLDGYDTGWHEPTYRHGASYANLPPGKYVFRLRMVTAPNRPAQEEVAISVRIKPAWWDSAAAWMLYAACLVGVVALINSLYLRLRTNRLRLLHEQREHERELRTTALNMSFFANISHEFRNPLTIIAGPLLSLRADKTLPQAVQTTLNRVCISVNRMLRLIDQMLDFNQLETDALRLQVGKVNVGELLHGLASAFAESAKVRGIVLRQQVSDACQTVWLDTDKIEKIMSNLFTNALKHTPDGGTISISADVACGGSGALQNCGQWLTVAVRNSGGHIPEERIADVFKRYYQVSAAADTHRYGWGSGIGLYYVHRLVQLHHGRIAVRNVGGGNAGGGGAEDCGVEFEFSIPVDAGMFKKEEFAESGKRVMQLPVSAEEADIACKETPAEGNGKKARILIVDDDTDVAMYIRSIFAPHYDVVNRYSAEDALADMEAIAPDIVLSDVVMGKMSGYDFCRQLKQNLMFCHIPVVLITAKSNMDEQIGGLRLGAVAYVTKPFDPAYLHALVESQLNGMLTMRRRLGESTRTADAPDVADTMTDADRHFMDELYALMERRASEQELNVATVCRDLLISQSKFNYKLKQLTGDTPGAFFRKYKLNRAAQMLHEGSHTVAEVAAITGFGTAAHFSVAFKKQFGVVPSEYK